MCRRSKLNVKMLGDRFGGDQRETSNGSGVFSGLVGAGPRRSFVSDSLYLVVEGMPSDVKPLRVSA